MRSLFLVSLFFLTVTAAWALSPESAVPVLSETDAKVVDILPVGAKLLGEQEENGVLATAWLYRTTPEQAVEYPYLLFVRFIGTDNNILVEKGLVAYKIEDNDGQRSPARKLNFKNGYFVAGLTAVSRDSQAFLVGCKLEDEKKRQYRFALQLRK